MTNPFRKLWRAARPHKPSDKKKLDSTPAGDVLHLGERRVAKRQLHPLPGILRYVIAGSETPVRIHDFSAKGLCFRGEVRLPIGAAVEITATLPQTPGFASRKVRYLAHVVRVTREPGKFVTAVLIFSCETLAQESPETIGAEPRAGASSRAQGSREVELRPKAAASTPRSRNRKTTASFRATTVPARCNTEWRMVGWLCPAKSAISASLDALFRPPSPARWAPTLKSSCRPEKRGSIAKPRLNP